MGLAAHQEEIIAQLYREMYRKLVVYADTPQGQRRRSCQQCADYRTHLLEYRSAPAHDLDAGKYSIAVLFPCITSSSIIQPRFSLIPP